MIRKSVVEALKSAHRKFLAPYQDESYSVKSRVEVLLVLLYLIPPIFLAVVMTAYVVRGQVSNLLTSAGIIVLTGILLFLIKKAKAAAAAFVFSLGLAFLFMAGHFTGDYRTLNSIDVILIDRLAYLGAINLILACLITGELRTISLLSFIYLAAGVFQLFWLQAPAMDAENRGLLVVGGTRFILSFVFVVGFVFILMRFITRSVATADQAKTSLEQEVQQRTRELRSAMDHLQTVQKNLLEGAKLAILGRLSATVAHEVNSPLGAILSSASLVHDSIGAVAERSLQVFRSFDPKAQARFLAMIQECEDTVPESNHKERHRQRQSLVAELTALSIEPAEVLAELLLDLGIKKLERDWNGLLRLPNNREVLELGLQITDLTRSSENIRKAAAKASEYVSALRKFTFSDNVEADKATIDLAESINTALLILKSELGSGVSVIRNFTRLTQIQGYPNQLLQVWTNLFANAIHAMGGKGDLKITVLVSGKRTLVEVQDSGEGIPPHLKERIFEPFFTTKKYGEGTGLGLQIVHDIVSFHGGEITFESVPGRTVFRILL